MKVTGTQDSPKRLRKRVDARPLLTVEDVVALIEGGNLDAGIRPIVRACFYRRERLYGDAHVIPDTPDNLESRSPLPPVVRTGKKPRRVPRVSPMNINAVTAPSRPALTDLDAMYEWFDNANAVQMAPASVKPSPGIESSNRRYGVEYAGQWYDKRDFTGNVIVINDPRSEVYGLRCGIVGIGPSQVKMLVLEEPAGDTNTEIYAKWRDHLPHFESHRMVLNELIDPY